MSFDQSRSAHQAIDMGPITRRFYKRFKVEHAALLKSIQGIPSEADREWYTSLLLNRLMFLYFLQKKGFLDGDIDYLANHLRKMQGYRAKDTRLSFYRDFLLRLFHAGLSKQIHADAQLGKVPYLDVDLLEVHELERNHPDIQIADEAFVRLFAFFDAYQWHLDERGLCADNEINPNVLGYIFEQYINSKQKGTHYTQEDISEYIAKNTIIPFLFDATEKRCPAAFGSDGPIWRLLRDDPDRYIYEALRCGDYLPTEVEQEYVARRKRCVEIKAKLAAGEITTINDLITYNFDIRRFARDVIENCEEPGLLRVFYASIEQVRVLDPTCGSGAFLLAALDVLEPLYEACFDRMGQTAGRYFILKSIILNNLYGVDIMKQATEVCKLRLLLKLVASIERLEDFEPLPSLDFNIRTGNILVGVANYDEARRIGWGEQLEGLQLGELRSVLDRCLCREHSVDPYDALAFEQWHASHQPFHWFVEFKKIMKTGGFDVIIGNPPYVEYAEVKPIYQLLPSIYKTGACGNLYAYCIERSVTLLKQGGRWGMIVPLSGFATERMHSLQQVVMEHSSCLHLSFLSGDANPSRLFEGVKFRLCIGLAYKAGDDRDESSCFTYYSTKYVRWYAEERNNLFSSLQYCRSTDAIIKGSLPKIGQDIELAILEKMSRQSALGIFAWHGDKTLYYHNCPVNWIRATTFVPAFRSDRDGTKVSSQIRQIHYSTEALRDAAVCIINSSLFFWFWLIYSDSYHLTDREIGGFPINLDELVRQWGDVLSSISDKLMYDYKNNSRPRTYVYKTTGTVVYDEFYPKLSKPIIDEIDCVLAKHYGFTDEELDFIINYEIKYRMGQAVITYPQSRASYPGIGNQSPRQDSTRDTV